MAGEDESNDVKVPLQDNPQGTPKLGSKSRSENELTGSTSMLKKMAEKRLQVSLDELRDFHDNITLSWKDVNVYAKAKAKGGFLSCRRKGGQAEEPPKQILTDVSGVVKPGTLLAIMGASGAGKTTLLNVLTRRNVQKLRVKGKVCVNGQTLGAAITAVSAYVQQMDLFIGTMKVKEHLWFCAQLRMDQHLSNEARNTRVNDVINELGLAKCADTIIGTPGKTKGISGGERKRLAFASEILIDPALMFCDEPTSGLDAFMAQSVVETLKNMAGKGKTIVCTIHQPASEVYALFDRILLLAEGRVAFMGHTSDALGFFKSVGYQCPANFNPADFFIHTLAVMPGKEQECREIVKKTCDGFEQTAMCEDMRKEVGSIHSEADRDAVDDEIEDLKTVSLYKVTWTKQFFAVFWRCWMINVREPMLMKARIFQTIVASIVTGLIFLKQPYNQKGIMNINGALFIMLVQVSYSNLLAVLNTFPIEFPVYQREHSNGMYRAGVYFLCKSFSELPIFLGLPFIYTAIMYWMIGFYSDPVTFLIAAVVIVLCTNISVSFGYIISISASDVTMALSVAPLLIIPLMLFGGFFLNSSSVPVYFIWLEYLSWFKYGQEVLVVNQWRHITNISCEYGSTGAIADILSNVTSTVLPPSGSVSEGDTPCFHTGHQVIESLSFNKDNIGIDFLVMFILLFGFRVISYLLLAMKSGTRK